MGIVQTNQMTATIFIVITVAFTNSARILIRAAIPAIVTDRTAYAVCLGINRFAGLPYACKIGIDDSVSSCASHAVIIRASTRGDAIRIHISASSPFEDVIKRN